MKAPTLLAGGLLAACLYPSYAELAADDAYRWLERMDQAARQKTYIGEFAYVRGEYLSNMRVVHGVGPEGEYEWVSALDGPRREYVRNSAGIYCLLPNNERLSVRRELPERRFSRALPGKLDELRAYYDARLAGQGRVAGRAAQIVEVLPRDRYRFGFRLWADRETGLLLKASVLNGDRHVIEQFGYTSIEFPETIPVDMRQPPNLTEFRSVADGGAEDPEAGEEAEAGAPQHAEPGWSIGALPAGFTQRNHFRRRDGGHVVEHLVFSDGIASVSVFVEPVHAQSERYVGQSRLGVVNVQTDIVGQRRVTVMGEVPPETLELIRSSLQPVAAP